MYLPEPTAGDFELAPAGTYLAVCYRVIDLGTQKSTFQGKEKSAHKILISWELQGEDSMMKDGRPFTIGQRFTWSMHEKASLRKTLESWRGVAFTERDFGPHGFNIKNIIGKSCLLTVAHKEEGDKIYANITAVTKLMKGMQGNPPVNEKLYLWLHREYFEESTFHKLGQGLQGIIMKAPEYAELQAPATVPGEPEVQDKELVAEEIPF